MNFEDQLKALIAYGMEIEEAKTSFERAFDSNSVFITKKDEEELKQEIEDLTIKADLLVKKLVAEREALL